MMTAVAEDGAQLGRRALRLKSALLGKDALDPWDLSAPLDRKAANETDGARSAFSRAASMVTEALNQISPEMAYVVRMMVGKRWVDAAGRPGKTVPGQTVTFERSRRPRIVLTYHGRLQDVVALAHEMGHAHHHWLLRDTPIDEAETPYCFAEIPSTFAETACLAYLLGQDASGPALSSLVATALDSAATYLLTCPIMYHFECALFDRRATGHVPAAELTTIHEDLQRKWRRDTVRGTSAVGWMSQDAHYRAHFYNWQYTLGYLLSPGLLAMHNRLGPDFYPRYKAFLLDAGRMTLDEAAAIHLGVQLNNPEFWREAIATRRQQLGSLTRALGVDRRVLRIYTDLTCGGSFLAAVTAVPRLAEDFGLQIDWRPFESDPKTPPEGQSTEHWHGVDALLQEARSLGVELHLPAWQPNMKRILAMTEWTRDQGRLPELWSALGTAYWREGMRLNSDDQLAEIARRSGLNPAAAVEASDNPMYARRVAATRAEFAACVPKDKRRFPLFAIDDEFILGYENYAELAANVRRALAVAADGP